jgi:hypothetical protein
MSVNSSRGIQRSATSAVAGSTALLGAGRTRSTRSRLECHERILHRLLFSAAPRSWRRHRRSWSGLWVIRKDVLWEGASRARSPMTRLLDLSLPASPKRRCANSEYYE